MRYFFHIHDGTQILDREGLELADMQAVKEQAITMAGAILKDIDGDFSGEEWSMEVVDGANRPVMTLRFSVIEHAR